MDDHPTTTVEADAGPAALRDACLADAIRNLTLAITDFERAAARTAGTSTEAVGDRSALRSLAQSTRITRMAAVGLREGLQVKDANRHKPRRSELQCPQCDKRMRPYGNAQGTRPDSWECPECHLVLVHTS